MTLASQDSLAMVTRSQRRTVSSVMAEVKWEQNKYLPPGWMSEEEGRGLGVIEGLNLRHQDLQQFLCSNIMHTMMLRLLKEEVNWAHTFELARGSNWDQ